jgi:hypothetical protein
MSPRAFLAPAVEIAELVLVRAAPALAASMVSVAAGDAMAPLAHVLVLLAALALARTRAGPPLLATDVAALAVKGAGQLADRLLKPALARVPLVVRAASLEQAVVRAGVALTRELLADARLREGVAGPERGQHCRYGRTGHDPDHAPARHRLRDLSGEMIEEITHRAIANAASHAPILRNGDRQLDPARKPTPDYAG